VTLPVPVAAPDPDLLRAAVLACPSVARLSGGLPGARVATYLPGRRVPGVVIGDGAVTLHVVVRYPTTVHGVVSDVRRATAPLAPGCRIDIVVADLLLPEEAPATGAPLPS